MEGAWGFWGLGLPVYSGWRASRAGRRRLDFILSVTGDETITVGPQKVNLKEVFGMYLGEKRLEKGRQVSMYWNNPSMGLEVEGNGKEGMNQDN